MRRLGKAEAIGAALTWLRISLVTFIISAPLTAFPIYGAQKRTSEDDIADREFAIAQTQITFIHRILDVEMQRIMAERTEPPSAEVAKLFDSAPSKIPDIGDTRIPLHLRLIERERLNFVAGVELARSSVGHCGETSANPSQLVNKQGRDRILKSLQCHREKLDRYQHGMHDVNKAHEMTGLALKLPPFTQERVLTQNRQSTQWQDADLEAAYALERERDQSAEYVTKFLDTHSAGLHLVNGQLMFENDADARAANLLLNREAAAERKVQDEAVEH